MAAAPAAAAALSIVLVVADLVLLLCTAINFSASMVAAATWCVARSDAIDRTLQTALDYACGAGADCAPIQSSGMCYLPNTLQAHASYAFNNYFQRRGNAPGSCTFAGTATIAKTDPSYGSCVYPSSPSAARGTGRPGTSAGTTIPGTTPTTSLPPPPPGTITPLHGGGSLTPGTGPIDSQPRSSAYRVLSIETIMSSVSFVLVFLFIFQAV
ncbi:PLASMODESMATA CALLOSE-BINDING PROTEIN 3-like [Olea europaea subsp. europaea]|uniref:PLASMODESMATA CALLOSE-BINDING PROTEIN 3-like n=1 Tax=Olea europaea subsp. europaea TaxID=158383 RepID=A0A8S0V4N8_OLEEU|nr:PLASMODESMATA CALLOSE-BINDING PROTEIN 3-like [Olea europaea subsp. europaea]